jgi:hypothetical protein
MTNGNGLARDFFIDDDGNPTVHHSFFVLRDEYQDGGKKSKGGKSKTGFAKVLNGNAMLRYEKWGLKVADLEAAWIGRYAWASLGFSFKYPKEILRNFRSYIARVGKDWPAAKRAKAIAMAEASVGRSWDFAKMDLDGELFLDEYNKNPTERLPLGKAFLLSPESDMWDGVMALDPANPGYRHALEVQRVWERE